MELAEPKAFVSFIPWAFPKASFWLISWIWVTCSLTSGWKGTRESKSSHFFSPNGRRWMRIKKGGAENYCCINQIIMLPTAWEQDRNWDAFGNCWTSTTVDMGAKIKDFWDTCSVGHHGDSIDRNRKVVEKIRPGVLNTVFFSSRPVLGLVRRWSLWYGWEPFVKPGLESVPGSFSSGLESSATSLPLGRNRSSYVFIVSTTTRHSGIFSYKNNPVQNRMRVTYYSVWHLKRSLNHVFSHFWLPL